MAPDDTLFMPVNRYSTSVYADNVPAVNAANGNGDAPNTGAGGSGGAAGGEVPPIDAGVGGSLQAGSSPDSQNAGHETGE